MKSPTAVARSSRPTSFGDSRPINRTKTDRLAVAFFYIVIVIAAFNTVLRTDMESSVTLYYAISPVVGLVLLAKTRWFFMWSVLFVLAAVYGILAAKVFGTPDYFYLPQLAFYGFLLVFFGVMRFQMTRDPNFSRNIMRLLWFLFIMVFMLSLSEAMTGIRIPNLPNNDPSYLLGYFYTANDVALFISAALAVIIIRPGSLAVKFAATAGVFVINSINDAKAAMLAIILIAVVFFASKMTSRLRLPPLVLGGVAALGTIMIVFGGRAIDVQIGGVEYNLYDLLAEPVTRIFHLNTYNMPGSIFDRSDALIINLREFISTNGLGLGPGGSTYVLSLPENRLATAESMHNGVAELGVEMGMVFLIPLGLWVYKVCFRMMQVRPSRGDLARFAFLCGLPFLSVTQSSGFISNYATWMVVFLFVAAPDSFWSGGQLAISRPVQAVRRQARMPWESGRYVR